MSITEIICIILVGVGCFEVGWRFGYERGFKEALNAISRLTQEIANKLPQKKGENTNGANDQIEK